MTREAINELKKYTSGRKNTEKVELSVLQINRIIKALEQESEQKTGKWIDDHGNQTCSKCGTAYPDLYPDYYDAIRCPHCGAKMQEGEG